MKNINELRLAIIEATANNLIIGNKILEEEMPALKRLWDMLGIEHGSHSIGYALQGETVSEYSSTEKGFRGTHYTDKKSAGEAAGGWLLGSTYCSNSFMEGKEGFDFYTSHSSYRDFSLGYGDRYSSSSEKTYYKGEIFKSIFFLADETEIQEENNRDFQKIGVRVTGKITPKNEIDGMMGAYLLIQKEQQPVYTEKCFLFSGRRDLLAPAMQDFANYMANVPKEDKYWTWNEAKWKNAYFQETEEGLMVQYCTKKTYLNGKVEYATADGDIDYYPHHELLHQRFLSYPYGGTSLWENISVEAIELPKAAILYNHFMSNDKNGVFEKKIFIAEFGNIVINKDGVSFEKEVPASIHALFPVSIHTLAVREYGFEDLIKVLKNPIGTPVKDTLKTKMSAIKASLLATDKPEAACVLSAFETLFNEADVIRGAAHAINWAKL
jgi:hypothetical protein